MRVLTGIQASGKLHLGNYFGAMKQMIELQENHELFTFIAQLSFTYKLKRCNTS